MSVKNVEAIDQQVQAGENHWCVLCYEAHEPAWARRFRQTHTYRGAESLCSGRGGQRQLCSRHSMPQRDCQHARTAFFTYCPGASNSEPIARLAVAWVEMASPYSLESPCVGRGIRDKTCGCAALMDARIYFAHHVAAISMAAKSMLYNIIVSNGRRNGGAEPGQVSSHRWPWSSIR